MQLTALRIRHFRNLGMQDLVVPRAGVAIVGENAQGKTNLIEAVYYLETFRSFRGARDEELVGFGQDVFRVSATLSGEGGVADVSAAFQRQGKRKKVTVDGAEPERLGAALGRMAAVVFSPADVSIVSGGPAERRRFLDILLSLNVPGYLEALQRFRHVLTQRNACLRDGRPEAEVQAWDGALADSGAEVVVARRNWVDAYAPGFAQRHGKMAGSESALMEYEGSVPLEGVHTLGDVALAYRDALRASAARERRLGITVVGPHRDEVALRVRREGEGWIDVRRFGSGGQRRTVALALRLVEAQTIRDARGRAPLVLLDDVFAELDAARSERVLDLLDGADAGQVILTAPKESDVRLRRDDLPRWCVRDGTFLT